MSATAILHLSLLLAQTDINSENPRTSEASPLRTPAALRMFKDREPAAEPTPQPKPTFIQYGNSSRRPPRSTFPVGDGPVDTIPTNEGPVGPQDEIVTQPEVLSDREDPRWNQALTAPNTQTPHRRGQQPYAQLGHTVRPPAQQVPPTAAGHMVARWFEPAREEHSDRNELTLLDALEGTSDPGERARMVMAYWTSAGAAAEERCARDEVGWLNSFNEQSGGANLQAAKRSAEAELLTAEVKRDEASEALARLVHRTGIERYPLPCDLPCVEAYRTHAENLLAGRSEGDEMKRLARKLPPLLNVVAARAKAVEAAEVLQRQIAEGRTQATAADVLTAYQELRHQRREWVTAVTTYNQAIARYAFGAADRGLEPNRAVAMLVARPRQSVRALQGRGGYDQSQIASPIEEEGAYLRRPALR